MGSSVKAGHHREGLPSASKSCAKASFCLPGSRVDIKETRVATEQNQGRGRSVAPTVETEQGG